MNKKRSNHRITDTQLLTDLRRVARLLGRRSLPAGLYDHQASFDVSESPPRLRMFANPNSS